MLGLNIGGTHSMVNLQFKLLGGSSPETYRSFH